ncbi:MAG: aldehyde dehydrogenase family protein, partial [Bacteroidota bacterium]|nr:aldehyde dehydrogenase family protein [Bacteroidota bacterium]
MNLGYFSYPLPVNEQVKSYAPGSTEKISLKKTLLELKSREHDIPAIIGGKEIRSGNKVKMRPPHELTHTLGYFHRSDKNDILLAIEAALKAKPSWEKMNWENRAAVFLKAADLLSGTYRDLLNGTTMLGQSKNVYQAEIDSACELIDFLRFNVHYLHEIYKQQPVSSPGVHNRLEYRPLEGFVLAITPFNFTAIGGNLPTSAALC